MYPKSRKTNLKTERINDEWLVLDTDTSVAHYLHPVTARIWIHADGTRSVDQLLAIVREQDDPEADEDVIWHALDALAEADLLEERVAPPVGSQRTSRRDLMRRIAAATAGAAVASFPLSPAFASSPVEGSEQSAKEEQSKLEEQEQQGKEQEEKQAQLLRREKRKKRKKQKKEKKRKKKRDD